MHWNVRNDDKVRVMVFDAIAMTIAKNRCAADHPPIASSARIIIAEQCRPMTDEHPHHGE
jgi:hypothetical protein